MMLLPLYSLLRLTIDAFTNSNLYGLQSIQTVLLLTALVVTSQHLEKKQDQ
jgi:hypothetical protein